MKLLRLFLFLKIPYNLRLFLDNLLPDQDEEVVAQIAVYIWAKALTVIPFRPRW